MEEGEGGGKREGNEGRTFPHPPTSALKGAWPFVPGPAQPGAARHPASSPSESASGAREEGEKEEGMEPVSWMWGLGLAVVVANGASLLVIVVLSVAALVLTQRVVAVGLEQVAEAMPKVETLVEMSGVDPAVLIAVCEEAGLTAEALAGFYKEEMGDRKGVVQRRFGAQSPLTKRFLAWPGSQFMARGYPVEPLLAPFLTDATLDPALLAPTPNPSNIPYLPKATGPEHKIVKK